MEKRQKIMFIICFGILCGSFSVTQWNQSRQTMLPVEHKTIVLDAGHGGWDPGKTETGSADEKEINLAIVQYLREYLEMGGAQVILTREEDGALGESKREDMAKRQTIADGEGVDLLVSIHQNAFTSSVAKGTRVFYHKQSEAGKEAAQAIQEALTAEMEESAKDAKENDSYYILRATKTAAVLVECGFLSNPAEAQLLNTEAYQKRIAWAIYCGIQNYFGNTQM